MNAAHRMLDLANDDHRRGCEGRTYTCSCGYDARVDAALRDGASDLTNLLAARSEALAVVQLLGARLKEVVAERDKLRKALAGISLLQQDRQSNDTEKIDQAGRIARRALREGK